MVFQRSLSDSKCPQVSRTLFSMQADLNNAVVWRDSTCMHISKSSCILTIPLGIVLSIIILDTVLKLILTDFVITKIY